MINRYFFLKKEIGSISSQNRIAETSKFGISRVYFQNLRIYVQFLPEFELSEFCDRVSVFKIRFGKGFRISK